MNAIKAKSIRVGVSRFWPYSWYIIDHLNYLQNLFKNKLIDSFFSNVFFKNSLESFGFVYDNIDLINLANGMVFVRINFYFTKYMIFLRVVLKKLYKIGGKTFGRKNPLSFLSFGFLLFRLKLFLYLRRIRIKQRFIKRFYNFFFLSIFFNNIFILYRFYKVYKSHFFYDFDRLRERFYKGIMQYFFFKFFDALKYYFNFFVVNNYKEINKVIIGLNILKKGEISASLIARYIKRRLENYFKFSDFIKRVCRDLELNFYGFLIQGKGRFTRRQRTTKLIFKYRGIYPGTIGRFLDYGKSFAILKYSICCIKVWLSQIEVQ